jgi:hypothetical protein
MRLLSFLGACALSAVALSSTNANAANLIVNGGFETGDFSGWTADPVSYPMYIVTSPVYQGKYAAQIAGYDYGPDTLTQTVSDTANQNYYLSFYIYQSPPGPTVSLDVTWNGATVISDIAPTTGDFWKHFVTQVIGTGSDTLQFIDANNPGFDYLDNVSLTTSIPEPATWAMMMLGFAGLGFAGYRMAKSARTALAA